MRFPRKAVMLQSKTVWRGNSPVAVHRDLVLRHQAPPDAGVGMDRQSLVQQRGGTHEQRAVDVDRVARRRHERRVARLEERPHQVAEPLLRTDRVDDLGLLAQEIMKTAD